MAARMRRMLGTGSLFFMLLGACGPGSTPEVDLALFQNPIIRGEPDEHPQHNAVVYLQIDVGGGWAAACSGTLIDQQVVLTAAHCVCQTNSTTQYAADRFDVFFGNSTASFTSRRSVSEVQRHPNYDPDWYYGGILLTEDKDFGRLVYASGKRTTGIIFFRFPASVRKELSSSAVQGVRRFGDQLAGSFTVIEPGRVRIGQLPG